MIWTLGDFNSVYLLTGGGPADLTHVLATLGIRYLRLDQVDLAMASIVVALPLVLPLVYFMMKRLSRNEPRASRWKKVSAEAQAAADRHPGVPVDDRSRSTTCSCSRSRRRDSATSGRLWPKEPTLQNFRIVFHQKHFYLNHFWLQMLQFGGDRGGGRRDHAVHRHLRRRSRSAGSRCAGGRTVMNLALFTYFIPAAFLAVPMYKTMGIYGLLNNQWALILAMVTIASPYCIWVLKQASRQAAVGARRGRAHRRRQRRCSCSAWSTCR